MYARGKEVERSFFDAEGKPTRARGGGGNPRKFDKRGQLWSEEEYFGDAPIRQIATSFTFNAGHARAAVDQSLAGLRGGLRETDGAGSEGVAQALQGSFRSTTTLT